MISFRRRLIGRRQEIYAAIREGRYREWLLKSSVDPHVRSKVISFRRRLLGRRKEMVLIIQDELDRIEANHDSAFLISRTVQSRWIPEQRLWGAVLIRAIYDFVTFFKCPADNIKKDGTSMRLGQEVRDWFDDQEDLEEVGTFSWICYVLDLGDWRDLRDKIFTLTRRHLPRQCRSHKKK